MSSHAVRLESRGDSGRVLSQITSVTNDEKTEQWLQDLIFERPEILPVQDFDASASLLIPVARELGTQAGPIDDVFLTEEGRLVIVETKLWKNPEKHRTVVAQVIDYAKEIAGWTYDELNEAVLRASRARKGAEITSLTDIIQGSVHGSDSKLADLQENLIANMAQGRFLLLIVGDKISPNLALLGGSIQGAPGLDFQLGLVEMCMYPIEDGQDWPLLITADVVGRTVEYRRAVVTVKYQQEKPEVDVATPDEEQEAPGTRGRTTLAAISAAMPPEISPIFDKAVSDWQANGHTIFVGSLGMTFRCLSKGAAETALGVYPDTVAVYRREDLEDYPSQVVESYLQAVRSVAAAQRVMAQKRRYVKLDTITANEFATILDASLQSGAALAD